MLPKGSLHEAGRFGGESRIVCEHRSVIVFDVAAYPEPKSLRKSDLQAMYQDAGTIAEVSRLTGLAWAAVQERLKPRRRWCSKLGQFVPVTPDKA